MKYCKLYKEYIFKVHNSENDHNAPILHCVPVSQDAGWTRMEEEVPDLYREAVAMVSPVECSPGEHKECVRRSNRYQGLRGEQ